MSDAPRLFVSYSHDDQAHKDWVLNLSNRLVANGVNVVLDQWDMTLGGDLVSFMEIGLVDADRVLAICSSSYVKKANQSLGGTGYEKMILTGQLMTSLGSERIIPVIRNNATENLQPTFLKTRLFVDFRNDATFEAKYAELLRNIHGQPITPRPQLGPNPFIDSIPDIEPRTAYSHTRYVSPALAGEVTFDYSNNKGSYVLGAGDMLFETKWLQRDSTSVYAYSDPPSIRNLALAIGVSKISEIKDARLFDTSSCSRSPHLNEIVVWQNTAGYFLAVQINSIKSRGHGASVDEIVFRYLIMPNKGFDFTEDDNERFTAEEIVGASSDPKSDGLWQANWPAEHSGPIGTSLKVIPVQASRAWLRVIPINYTRDTPSVAALDNLPDSARLKAPHGGGNNGDSGSCEFGYVVYWISKFENGGPRKAHNLAAFLEESGEVWMSDGCAFHSIDNDKQIICHESIQSNWALGLENAMACLDALGASKHRRIIVGIEGLKNSIWNQLGNILPTRSRKADMVYEETKREWLVQDQTNFLFAAWNNLRNTFSIAPMTKEKFEECFQLGRRN